MAPGDETVPRELTHIDQSGHAHMVDVAAKAVTHRSATASGFVSMLPGTLAMITEGRAKKGDVFAVARIAGIQGAKRTSELIPLCHPLPLTRVAVDLEPVLAQATGVRITAVAETDGKTGVEMEALTAVSVAALALYDMCKAVDRWMTVSEIKLLEKSGGKSGHWVRPEEQSAQHGAE